MIPEMHSIMLFICLYWCFCTINDATEVKVIQLWNHNYDADSSEKKFKKLFVPFIFIFAFVENNFSRNRMLPRVFRRARERKIYIFLFVRQMNMFWLHHTALCYTPVTPRLVTRIITATHYNNVMTILL